MLESVSPIMTHAFLADLHLVAEWNPVTDGTRCCGAQLVEIKTIASKKFSVAIVAVDLVVRFSGTILSKTRLARGSTAMFDAMIVSFIAFMTVVGVLEESRQGFGKTEVMVD